jgi:hypothetical protein
MVHSSAASPGWVSVSSRGTLCLYGALANGIVDPGGHKFRLRCDPPHKQSATAK